MPPIYFLAVLVVVAGSACFADGGGDTAAELTVQCPGDSCAEICKCYPECGPSNCSRRGDNYTILLQLGYCLDIHRHLVECPYVSSRWRMDKTMQYYIFQFYELFINHSMCDDLNRKSNLCSRCKEGYGVAIYSGSWYCSRCTLGGYAWLLYITLETVPVTVFFLAVVFFNVRATSPPMTGFIMFNQIMITILRNQIIMVPLLKMYPKAKYFVNIGCTLSGIWNLDFFRDTLPPFCITYHLTNFGVVLVRGLFVLYPFLLVLISVAGIKLHNRGFRPIVSLCRPIHQYFARHRRAFNANASLVDAVATFLLLSYSKLATGFLYFFRWVNVHILCGNASTYTSYYILPNGHDELWKIILFCIVSLVVLALPSILLTVYPIKRFRKCLAYTRLNDWQPLHMFVERFQGDYKDGTRGTYDYRFISGMYLIFRIAFLLPIDSSYIARGPYVMLSLVLFLFMALLFALFRPYKMNYMNILESLIFILCCLICLCYYYFKFLASLHDKIIYFALTCILAAIPMCAFILYSGYRCINACVRRSQWLAYILSRCTARAQGSGEESETLVENFADRLRTPRRYGSLGEESSDTGRDEFKSSGDLVYQ